MTGPSPNGPPRVDAPTEQSPSWGSSPAPPAAAPTVQYGGFWRRTVAHLADTAILFLAYIPVAIVFLLGPNSPAWIVALVIASMVQFAYFPFFWSRTGSTPAMAALGLRVVRKTDGRRVGGWRAIGRSFALLLASLPLYLGLLWAAWEPRKRGWHDMLAGTLVIRTPEASKNKRVATYVAAGVAIVLPLLGVAAMIYVEASALGRPAVGTSAPGVSTAAPLTEPTTMPFEDLGIGHCFDFNEFDEAAVDAVPCDEPHVFELAAVRELPPGEFPDTASEQDNLATLACQQPVLRHLGTSSADAYISYEGMFEEDWEAGDRRVWCLVNNEDFTPVEGSARDGWR